MISCLNPDAKDLANHGAEVASEQSQGSSEASTGGGEPKRAPSRAPSTDPESEPLRAPLRDSCSGSCKVYYRGLHNLNRLWCRGVLDCQKRNHKEPPGK